MDTKHLEIKIVIFINYCTITTCDRARMAPARRRQAGNRQTCLPAGRRNGLKSVLKDFRNFVLINVIYLCLNELCSEPI